MRNFDLLVTDLDNTLYDWVGFYVPAFEAMVREISRISGVSIQELDESFKRVHVAHRTSEYAFAIEELDVLRRIDGRLGVDDLLTKYEPAVEAFRAVRNSRLRPYPGVVETLTELAQIGVPVVAHSDSMMGYVSRRVRQLGIDELLAAIVAPRDHGVPAGVSPRLSSRYSSGGTGARTLLLEIPNDLRKPDVRCLVPILDRFPTSTDRVMYVGDSPSRDLLLAKRAGMVGVWARYGHADQGGLYDRLVRISYWTEREVREEQRLSTEVASMPPALVIDSFPEILTLLSNAA